MNNLVHFIRDCEITKGWFQGLRDCAEEKEKGVNQYSIGKK